MIPQLPKLLAGLSLVLSAHCASAQYTDSLQFSIGTTATAATQAYQPLWLIANRYGTITDLPADLSTWVSFSNRHVYKGRSPLYDYLRTYRNLPALGVSYGLALYHNKHFQQLIVQQAFLKLDFNFLQLRIGRFQEIIGEVDPELSSGSLGVSSNALPVPKVSLAVPVYTDLPLTGGWVQFKGLFSHGWLYEDRLVKRAMLHEKNLYLRVGKEVLRVYAGYNRFAVWGGEHPEFGNLGNSWNDFRTLVMGRPLDDARPYLEDRPDRRGNQLGFIDYGFNLNLPVFQLTLYHQVPFEDRSGVKPLGNPDKLLGVQVHNKNLPTIFTSLTLEYLDTRYQSGDTKSGQDNYYNNRLYEQGWTYKGRTLGTPLFVDRDKAAQYLQEDIKGANRWNIVNNRIRGMHIGWKGNISPQLHFRTLMTYTENYGNYFNKGQFAPHKRQWYFMQEVIYRLPFWTLTAAVGLDTGELTDNVGTSLGLSYRLNKRNLSILHSKSKQPGNGWTKKD